ncbi:MAG: type II toxin-antitoxin system RelE/ParE family toxin [Verrucomicrobiaceae bacterium]|nr:MAG: type II toxin-antitoxin system RelE/ParE family toxin [Verrucomicrobiaceae bacterium]
MIEVLLSEGALNDLNSGFWFYEVQETGLGDYFAIQLRADIDGLRVTAGIHRKGDFGYHRLLSHKFPYAIYYTFQSNEATVLAVIDCRRNPDWIRKHLES